MIDIKLIRKDREAVEKKLKTKEPDTNLSEIVALDDKVRHLIAHVETLKAKRNEASKKIGLLKREGKDVTEVMDSVSQFADDIHKTDHEIAEIQARLNDLLSHLPNIPMDDIKVSPDPKDNVEIKSFGEKRVFDFEPKNHMELSENLGLFDFKRGAKISGTGWPVYRGLGARLEWALLNYMLEVNRKNGFEQAIVPIAVRRDTVYASGQLPKFENQQFKITDDDFDLFLIPTAEVSLNGLYMDEIISEEELPIKLMAYSPCFRREAGAAGEKERGLIRTHQFNKVELYCFTKPEDSEKVHAEMCATAEEILEGLGLHYRSMALVTGDMSFAAAYTVDIEAWLPGQDRYYEVSSVSNCTDYQARRSNTRLRRKGEKPEFTHTLNGSGLATSRLMVSLLENNQNADGSVNVPEVLWKYMGDIKVLKPTNA
jgi:seryl-tRNA synthetase